MPFIRDRETGKIMDPERNAVLTSAGGLSNGFKHWEITWSGEIIAFTAQDTRKYGGETQNILMGVDWYVVSMKIPESLKPKRAEVMGLIKEALEAYGLMYAPKQVECHAKFNPRLIQNHIL